MLAIILVSIFFKKQKRLKLKQTHTCRHTRMKTHTHTHTHMHARTCSHTTTTAKPNKNKMKEKPISEQQKSFHTWISTLHEKLYINHGHISQMTAKLNTKVQTNKEQCVTPDARIRYSVVTEVKLSDAAAILLCQVRWGLCDIQVCQRPATPWHPHLWRPIMLCIVFAVHLGVWIVLQFTWLTAMDEKWCQFHCSFRCLSFSLAHMVNSYGWKIMSDRWKMMFI